MLQKRAAHTFRKHGQVHPVRLHPDESAIPLRRLLFVSRDCGTSWLNVLSEDVAWIGALHCGVEPGMSLTSLLTAARSTPKRVRTTAKKLACYLRLTPCAS